MHKFNIIAMIMLAILMFSYNKSANSVAYVNPSKVLQGYHGSVIQYEIFQVKTKNWQQYIDLLSAELENLGQEHIVPRFVKEQQLLRYRAAIQQQAQQENQSLTKAVLEEINTYSQTVRQRA